MKLSKNQKNYIQQKRNHYKLKTIAFVIGVGISLTGCSFSFKNVTDKPDVITSFRQNIEITTENVNWQQIKEDNQEATAEFIDEIKNQASTVGEFQAASIVRVVDGDTIVVEINGAEEKVRLIGIDTPESVASQEYLEKTGKENTIAGKDASDYTKELLKDIDTVYLQKDQSETDPYGRLLRYVWLEIPDNPEDRTEIATKMLNGILVSNKVATAVTYEPDTHYADIFDELEND